jgi:hypothetical protein
MTWENQLHAAFQELNNTLRRTVICEPAHVDEIRRLVEERGLSGLWKVRSSLACPTGKIILIDENALRNVIWEGAQDVPDISTYTPPTKE